MLRISQWKQQDYRARFARTADELADFVEPLAEAGVNLFDCSTRRFWEAEFEGSDLSLSGWVKRLTGKAARMVGSLGIARAVLEKDAMAARRAVAAGAEEMGGASCRERGGQYGKIVVGAVLFTKKNKNK